MVKQAGSRSNVRKLRLATTSAALASVAALALTHGASAQGAPMVRIDTGEIEGSAARDVSSFKGIPFAAPPVGERRWRAPQPAAPWPGVRPAHEFGPSCPQVLVTPTQMSPLERTSEDCLYLNVWTTADRPSRPRPVMVWIHGGGFIAGAGSEAQFDGAGLARRGVVVVTFNYRLGRLGFFAHPAIDREHPDELKGNYGLLDQLAALRWVHRNIAAFGGDPRNVTVFGESAGGISTLALTTSPLARGLMTKAIVESGTISNFTMAPMEAATPDVRSAETAGAAWAKELGIDPGDPDAARALRALPLEKIAPTAPSLPQVMRIMAEARPMIDGRLIEQDPAAAYAKGDDLRIPLILGVNSLETRVWSFGAHGLGSVPISPEASPEAASDKTGAAAAFQIYLARTGDAQRARMLMASDRFMEGPALHVVDDASRNAPVYLYRFDATPSFARIGLPGAPHGTEIFYVFGTLDRFRDAAHPPEPTDLLLSARIMDYWTAFARSGAPTTSRGPRWTRYRSDDPQYMLFTEHGVGMQKVAPLTWLRDAAAAEAASSR